MPDEPVVTRNAAENRFEIVVDGAEAGRLLYVRAGAREILHHTEIDDGFAGRGLAGRLVAGAVDISRQDGRRVVPVCEYAQRWLGKHPELADIVDPVDDEAVRLAEQHGH